MVITNKKNTIKLLLFHYFTINITIYYNTISPRQKRILQFQFFKKLGGMQFLKSNVILAGHGF